jgi:hypothetical protein
MKDTNGEILLGALFSPLFLEDLGRIVRDASAKRHHHPTKKVLVKRRGWWCLLLPSTSYSHKK